MAQVCGRAASAGMPWTKPSSHAGENGANRYKNVDLNAHSALMADAWGFRGVVNSASDR